MLRPVLTWLLSGLFFASGAYILACGVYLNLLVLAARRYKPLDAPSGAAVTAFILLIPAHDEASIIETTVRHLSELSYPAHLLRRIVIADNCSDDTAARAQAAGVEVWVRTDPLQPGKGAALRWAIDQLAERLPGQAVAVLDADSRVSSAWLLRADAYLGAGAQAVQSFYSVESEGAGWRARLLAVALILFHHVRPAGREVLGWSAGLKGNGMVFARDLLDRAPWSTVTITEDLEFASLLAASGIRVAYDGGSEVLGLAGASRQAIRSQRLRWEGGRFRVMRLWGLRLLRRALATRSLIPLDAAMELFVLPLGLLAIVAGALVALTGAATAVGLTSAWWLAGGLLGLVLLALHVLGGLWAARAPGRLYRALALAPAYVAWKVLVYAWLLLGVERNRWIRTGRGTSRSEHPPS